MVKHGFVRTFDEAGRLVDEWGDADTGTNGCDGGEGGLAHAAVGIIPLGRRTPRLFG